MGVIYNIRYKEQIKDIIKFSKLAYYKQLVSAAGGNVSIRCGENILITSRNVSLRDVKAEDIALVNPKGEVLHVKTGGMASKETFFHLNVYRARPSVNCVMHLHPTYATLWSLTNREIPMLTESAKIKIRKVPVIPAEKPGSEALASAVCRTVLSASSDTDTFLLKNHGILVMGKTMEECFNQAELLEETAKIAVLHSILTK
ncbi:class II aldolase/adducin family protein [Treponema parvum]|uniref:class II aldolase/adducin family protein n=1 Tax=Treponema parvum TaxID=138851 RepID=UPI001AEBB7CC|nr:class II aldolase/adducin family protein [Treponema parvum]QTQ16888.1 class II aldolase/adducin family protein [Treponema parvum]